MRLLEEQEKKVELLNTALAEGEKSGDARKLDMQDIKRKAKQRAGLTPS